MHVVHASLMSLWLSFTESIIPVSKEVITNSTVAQLARQTVWKQEQNYKKKKTHQIRHAQFIFFFLNSKLTALLEMFSFIIFLLFESCPLSKENVKLYINVKLSKLMSSKWVRSTKGRSLKENTKDTFTPRGQVCTLLWNNY